MYIMFKRWTYGSSCQNCLRYPEMKEKNIFYDIYFAYF